MFRLPIRARTGQLISETNPIRVSRCTAPCLACRRLRYDATPERRPATLVSQGRWSSLGSAARATGQVIALCSRNSSMP